MSTSDRRPPPDPIALIRAAPRSRPFVVAQLGQSLDGRIATPTGESKWINGECALDHVHRVRAAVDAVVVGVGTVVADDPLLNVRRVPGRHPARVVIDPSGRVPPGARCLADDGCRRFVVIAEGRAPSAHLPAGVEVVRIAPRDGALHGADVLAALARHDLVSFLVEGGAATVSRFIDHGIVDRLHVLVAPVLLGSGKPGLSLAPIARLADARRPPAGVHPLPDGDVLFDLDLAATGPA